MNLRITIFIFVSSFFLLVCCNKEPDESTTGTISILVVDNDSEETPIPNVEITITPGNIIKMTNADGMAGFKVNTGDYYVNADVCCTGPGYIQYHEPVTVMANQSVNVKMIGCLRCL